MFGLLPLIVLGAIVYAIVSAVKRRDAASETGIGDGADVGRAFRYLLMLGSLIVAAIGLTELLGIALTTSEAQRGSTAEPLAMTIVAVPVFLLLARWSWRTHHDEAAERESAAWALYLAVALGVTLAVSVGNAFAVSDRLIASEWRGVAVAGLLVWGLAWAGHWWAWRRLRPTLGPNIQLWIGSAIGLWVGAFSAGFVIMRIVQELFDSRVDVDVRGSEEGMALAACGVAIGAAVWAWHWLRNGLHALRSTGWYVYVLLLGVFAGLAAAVIGGGYALYVVLEWAWGEPGTTSAATQFRDLAWPIGAVVVGGGAWAYHRTLVGPRGTTARTEVHRTYDYLVSAVALGAIAVALTILVVAVFTTITPASAAGDDNGGGINTLLAAVTALVVGAPMWAFTWRRIQATCAGNDEEIGAPSRRRYLYAIFGIGGAVAFGALISLLVVIFQAALGERSGGALAEDLDIPVALLLTTGVIAAYHWQVYRAERHVGVRTPTRDVLLVCDGVTAVDEIAARTHTRIRTLRRLDTAGEAPVDIDSIVAAIDRTEGQRLLVVVGDRAMEVVPYE